jgi:hypothetical protein
MKVKLTNKVNRFGYLGKKYMPGDIFEVDEAHFSSDYMLVIPETPIFNDLGVDAPVTVEPLEEKPKRKRKVEVDAEPTATA